MSKITIPDDATEIELNDEPQRIIKINSCNRGRIKKTYILRITSRKKIEIN